jgi:hypothetical protein
MFMDPWRLSLLRAAYFTCISRFGSHFDTLASVNARNGLKLMDLRGCSIFARDYQRGLSELEFNAYAYTATRNLFAS